MAIRGVHPITLNLYVEQYEAIADLAERERRTVTAMIRILLDVGLDSFAAKEEPPK